METVVNLQQQKGSQNGKLEAEKLKILTFFFEKLFIQYHQQRRATGTELELEARRRAGVQFAHALR